MYEIVTIDTAGNYSAEGVGSENEFDGIAEALDAIDSLIDLGGEWRACTYAVREIGTEYPEPGTRSDGPDEICAYCETQVTRLWVIPAIDEDAAWAELAGLHADGCEWITTRAHRL